MPRGSAIRWTADAGVRRPAPVADVPGHPYLRAMSPDDRTVSSDIESLVARFGRLVRGVGARRGLVGADLDEVLQDVRIRLWRAESAGKRLAELGASFLYQIATAAAVDLLRRRRTHGAATAVALDAPPLDVLGDGRELPVAGPSPHDVVEAGELAAQIDAALETVSRDRRVAVRMHLLGYDRDDIARAFGWSEARTRNLLYRGLDDLRRRLAALGVVPEGGR